jgi:hypothetical protein
MDRSGISRRCAGLGGARGRGGGSADGLRPHFAVTRSAEHSALHLPGMNMIRRPAEIARRSAKALKARPRDAFRRETFAPPREKAREMFRRFPKARRHFTEFYQVLLTN